LFAEAVGSSVMLPSYESITRRATAVPAAIAYPPAVGDQIDEHALADHTINYAIRFEKGLTILADA